MSRRAKVFLRIASEIVFSIAITLLIFYVTGWYSFTTLPTRLVFIRMVLVAAFLIAAAETVRLFIKKI